MNKELLDQRGATFLLIMMTIAKLFSVHPRMLAEKVGNSAWMVTLLAALVAWPGYLALSALLRRFPRQSLGQITRAALGRWMGSLFCLVYAVYFVYLGGIFMRQFEGSFRIAVLPRTPASALMVTFALGVAFLGYRGVEALCRLASYLFPLLFTLFCLLLLVTVRLADFRYLLPIFGEGMDLTLFWAFPESSVYSEVLVVGVLAGMLRVQEVHRVGGRAFWSAALIMTGCFALMGSVFPYPALSRLHFPMLDLARAVQAGEFFQRVEAVFVMIWYFFGSFKLAAALTSAAVLFRDLAGLPDYRPLVLPLTLIAYTIAFLPANTVVASLLDSYTLGTWSWPISFAMPAITLGAAALRGKWGTSADALSQ